MSKVNHCPGHYFFSVRTSHQEDTVLQQTNDSVHEREGRPHEEIVSLGPAALTQVDDQLISTLLKKIIPPQLCILFL